MRAPELDPANWHQHPPRQYDEDRRQLDSLTYGRRLDRDDYLRRDLARRSSGAFGADDLVNRTMELSMDSVDHSARPVLLHKVYIIRCTQCKTFFTDRGMRAILLLRPNIILFSTDAAPVNTGPLYSEGHVPTASELQDRTCECASQSLGCLCCGSAIGYHIISPCDRCLSSSANSSRSANGHRYVFHCGEVVAEERRWQHGEMGVVTPPVMVARERSRERAPSLSKSGAYIPPPPRTPSPLVTLPAPRPGDQVYWSHLQAGGECATPVDPAWRRDPSPPAGR